MKVMWLGSTPASLMAVNSFAASANRPLRERRVMREVHETVVSEVVFGLVWLLREMKGICCGGAGEGIPTAGRRAIGYVLNPNLD